MIKRLNLKSIELAIINFFTVALGLTVIFASLRGYAFEVSIDVEKVKTEAEVISSLSEKTQELKDKYRQYKEKRMSITALQEIQDIAKERKGDLIEMIHRDPNTALSFILSEEEQDVLQKIAGKDIEQKVIREGTLEILHTDDFENEISKTSYTLITLNNERISLHPVGKLKENFFAVKRLRIKGYQIDNEIIFRAASNINKVPRIKDEGGLDVLEMKRAALGTRNMAVFLINFQNASQGNLDISQTEQVVSLVRDYYRENSYNQLDILSDIFGPFTLPINQTCDFGVVSSEVSKVAQNSGIDLNSYSIVTIIAPFGPQHCGWRGLEQGSYIAITAQNMNPPLLGVHIISHELGHTLGTAHANFHYCGEFSRSGTSCVKREYKDIYDTMGNVSPWHFNAVRKRAFGWFNNSQVLSVFSNGRYTIEPLETNTNGIKALEIGDLLIEYRQPIGFDDVLSFKTNSDVYKGALLHFALMEGVSTRLIDSDTSLINLGDHWKPVLPVGRTFRDPVSNNTITVVSADSQSLVVDVKLNNGDESLLSIINFGYGPGNEISYSGKSCATNTHCVEVYPRGSLVELSAIHDSDSIFIEWGGVVLVLLLPAI